jgi:O-6-methylguanine DNA methyltransferase
MARLSCGSVTSGRSVRNGTSATRRPLVRLWLHMGGGPLSISVDRMGCRILTNNGAAVVEANENCNARNRAYCVGRETTSWRRRTAFDNGGADGRDHPLRAGRQLAGKLCRGDVRARSRDGRVRCGGRCNARRAASTFSPCRVRRRLGGHARDARAVDTLDRASRRADRAAARPARNRIRAAGLERSAQVPAGRTVNYGEVAASIGSPGEARAVAEACAANLLAVVVPCHRVVKKDGSIAGYRWGFKRKRALLERERQPLP